MPQLCSALLVRGRHTVMKSALDVWIWDLLRETLTRLTFDPGADQYPVWTPDGTRVVFSSTADGASNLYWKAADGTGTADRLTESANAQRGHSFSPNGESLVFRENQPDTGVDLRVLSLAGDRGVETLVATAFSERNAELSPDGRWMAYESACTAPGSLDTHLCYAAWRSSYSSRASIGV